MSDLPETTDQPTDTPCGEITSRSLTASIYDVSIGGDSYFLTSPSSSRASSLSFSSLHVSHSSSHLSASTSSASSPYSFSPIDQPISPSSLSSPKTRNSFPDCIHRPTATLSIGTLKRSQTWLIPFAFSCRVFVCMCVWLFGLPLFFFYLSDGIENPDLHLYYSQTLGKRDQPERYAELKVLTKRGRFEPGTELFRVGMSFIHAHL